MSTRIPVTILSGYLGAGKTTIINRALTGGHGIRIGVLVNDFGPVNIDANLIAAEGEDLVELSNGCVCCSIGDDLGAAMSALAARPNPPERLLLEASGVAEPARIAMSAGYWPGFELDAVVVAADIETIEARARDKYVGRLVRNQLAAADLIVLTKSDLVRPERKTEVIQWLRLQRPEVRIVAAADGHVPLEILLGETGSAASRIMADPTHLHFATAVWNPQGPVDTARLAERMATLPTWVHRVKGFVQDAASGANMLVQVSGPRCAIVPVDDQVSHCLVMIGTAPRQDLEQLCTGLDGCLA
ncbi:MAG: GTP-binding protein [Proteobacteria bacterium]|nr:GTP-binding protein [Pseudomonadota bacterium]